MDRMRRIAGMGKTKVRSAVQKDKDESIVFFRELHKHEKHSDVNLLEPMYSVEFDTIQGGHTSKLPSGKRDFLIPVDEKHDYDWLQTTPAAPLFPSIEMEANYSEMVFQKELPIPRPVKSSASRFSGKPEAAKILARQAPPPPDYSSHKNLFKGAAPISKEKNQPCAIDKRSTYTAAVTNRQQKPAAPASARATAGTSSNTTKNHSDRCTASQGSSASAAKALAASAAEAPYTPPKNLLTTGSIFARRPPLTTTTKTQAGDPPLGAKVEGGKASRPLCPPAATRRGSKELQNGSPAKGKAVTSGEPVCNGGGHAGEAALVKGMKRTDGKSERKPRFATMNVSVDLL